MWRIEASKGLIAMLQKMSGSLSLYHCPQLEIFGIPSVTDCKEAAEKMAPASAAKAVSAATAIATTIN